MAEEFAPNEGTGQGHGQGAINKTDITNMPDGEFKAMNIRLLTALEKRMEYISETVNPEIRNNIAEIKGSVNKMRNLLDGMNSSLEETEI